jgi:putative transposase
VCKRRRHGHTRPGRGRWRAPDLVGRRFAAETLNRKWYGDGTEIGTEEGKLYLLGRVPQTFLAGLR